MPEHNFCSGYWPIGYIPKMIFRWLGVAGIELRFDGEILAIDPYFTRAPLRYILFGRMASDVYQKKPYLPAYNYILITHPHFDHIMDAGELLKHSGAKGYGSPNACRLMEVLGAPRENLMLITSGDHLELGPFSLDVYKFEHRATPIDRWINGDLPRALDVPLRLLDYRMDETYGFRIYANGLEILVGDLPMEADVLFTIPLGSREYYQQLLDNIKPRLVVPIHWDDFFRPLSKKVLPMLAPPKLAWPPVQRLNLLNFKHEIESISRDIHVLIPEIFNSYKLLYEIDRDRFN